MSVTSDAASVREVRLDGAVPLWLHPEWRERFPWLIQGTTSRGEQAEAFDLGLFGAQPVGEVLARWDAVRSQLGMPLAVHSRQVHGVELLRHEAAAHPGLLVTNGFDGHLTDQPGILLTISVADCVPVFLVAPRNRAVAVVHAGWRGAAAGVVERAAAELTGGALESEELWAHCGPSICGECYEVGPEVHAAVSPRRPIPGRPEPIDLRQAIAQRLVEAGVRMERISLSTHCTRCGDGGFFSHRGGSAGRQMGVLGIREPRG